MYLQEQKKKEFIESAPEKILKKINETKAKKVILKGKRGSGKTSILYYESQKSKNTNEPTIYMNFKNNQEAKIYPEYFTENFLKHYYEVLICKTILDYIRENYPNLYLRNFITYDEKIKEIYQHTLKLTSSFETEKLKETLIPQAFSHLIIQEMKKSIVDNINLAIDDFDFAHPNSKFFQTQLSKYFPLFNRVILGCSSKHIPTFRLNQKGYSIEEANYNNDLETVKQILQAQISDNTLYDNYFTDKNELIQKLIKTSNGNLAILINSLLNILNNDSIEKDLLEETRKNQKKYQKQKKLTQKEPKIYL